ncbi:MAG: hypothetical protein NTY38_20575 [Acidobacteria bacterium]|nr:hypothetical protein [Acidobacteriota bacterium]
MALSDDELRRVAAGIRLEQCVKPRNVLERVLDRVRWGEPFLLLETMRDSLGTLTVPGAYHLRVSTNGRLRWMAMVFGDSGSLLREARRRWKEFTQTVVYRSEDAEPRLLGEGPDELLAMTCGAGFLDLAGPEYRVRVLAAHEIVEGPYGLVALAGRVKKGLPVGLGALQPR